MTSQRSVEIGRNGAESGKKRRGFGEGDQMCPEDWTGAVVQECEGIEGVECLIILERGIQVVFEAWCPEEGSAPGGRDVVLWCQRPEMNIRAGNGRSE